MHKTGDFNSFFYTVYVTTINLHFIIMKVIAPKILFMQNNYSNRKVIVSVKYLRM